MGACDFSTYAAGKTPEAAFRAAWEQAAWEHGHGGYTGTIAEKGWFVHVVIPKGITFASFLKLMEESEEHSEVSYLRQTVEEARRFGKGARKTYGGKTLKQHEAALARASKRAAAFWKRVRGRGPGVEDALRRAIRVGGWDSDKWGPALCLGPVTGKAAEQALKYAVGTVSEHVDGQWRTRLPRGHRLYLFRGIASS